MPSLSSCLIYPTSSSSSQPSRAVECTGEKNIRSTCWGFFFFVVVAVLYTCTYECPEGQEPIRHKQHVFERTIKLACANIHTDILETRLTIPCLILSVWALAWYKNLSGSVPVLAPMKAVTVCVLSVCFPVNPTNLPMCVVAGSKTR